MYKRQALESHQKAARAWDEGFYKDLVTPWQGVSIDNNVPVSYTHLRAHETVLDLVCRLLLEKKTIHFNT